MNYPYEKTENEWLELLGAERYRILRQKGTEYPHSGVYNQHFDSGVYCCGGCGTPLFESQSKFDGHCGWPSFDACLPGSVAYNEDFTYGMSRIEIVCANCGGHLGHVFEDGPTISGKRYCVNSLSVDFENK